MKTSLIISFLLIGLGVQAQQRAEDYFNQAGKSFVHQALEKAIVTVDEGLKKFPSDAALIALRKKLEEEKKRQEQNQKDQEQQQKNQEQQNQEQKDQAQKDQEKGNKEQENTAQQQNEPKDRDSKKNQNKQDAQQGSDPKKPQAIKMSPEQIEQLLETMNNEEKKTQKKVNAQKTKGIRKKPQEKDW